MAFSPARGVGATAGTLPLTLAGLVTVALLMGAKGQDDSWYEHYHRGTQAIERSDWEGAIEELGLAVERREESNRNARTYGVRFVRYFPYYFLGVAHFSLGQNQEALHLLQHELDQGEIEKNDHYAASLQVLMAAIQGSGSGPATVPEDPSTLDELLRRGGDLRSQGRFLDALAVFGRVLALDSTVAEARSAAEDLRLLALQEELESFQIASRGEPGEGAEAVSPSAAALLESKAQEIFQRGVRLMSDGDLDGALTRFELTLAFLEDEGWTSRELYSEAIQHRDLIASEVRRKREAELRARLAAESNLPDTPPDIMLISPTDVEEPVRSEVLRLQGVAHDNHGISDIVFLLNGEEWGRAEIGQRRRDIKIAARPSPGGAGGYGTFAQFSKDIVLDQEENQVLVRVTNVNGTDAEMELKLKMEVEESRTFAAIIGIGDYADPEIPDLAYSVADAQALHSYLREDLGIPENQILTLLNEEATFQGMRRLFRTDLRSKAKENDQVIIYYAGHGAPDQFGDAGDGDGVEKYLLPYDTDPDDVSGTGYPMQDVAEALARLEATRVVYIVDACFSGASGGRTWGHGPGVTITDGFLGRLTGHTPGRVILSASAANEPSLESQALGHGVFTFFLLEGLRGAADGDGNRAVTVPEAYSYVARAVPENTGRRQHPTMSGELGGDMVLGRVVSGNN